jgi:SAM-dependent methyltransferase
MESQSSSLTRRLCRTVHPVQSLAASVLAGCFSDCARFDRWRSAHPGGRVPNQADPAYQGYLKKEMEYWRNPPHGDEETVHGNDEHPRRHLRLREHWNRLITGSPDKDKVRMLRERGPFDHALALSHCPGLEALMAAGVAERWTYNSITGRFTGLPLSEDRVTVVTEDLNFVQLEECAYDLIIGEGVLHHIVNADNLMIQVNRALRPDGIFYVMEYVGEERFKWRPEKRRYLNGLLATIPLEYLRYKFASVDIIRLGRLSPFEAVTSTRIPDLLAEYLSPIEERTGYGVLFPALEFLKERYLVQENPALDLLLQADQECERHNVLPSTLVGMYQKRAA